MKSSLFLTLLTIIGISCQKDTASNTAVTQKTVEKINLWIDAQKKENQIANSKIQSLKDNLLLNEISIEDLNENEKSIIAPISNNFKPRNNKDKQVVNVLIMIQDQKGVIRKGNIVQYDNNKGSRSLIPPNVISKIYKSEEIEVDGKFRILSVYDQYLYELSYQHGKLQSYSAMKPRAKYSSNSK